MAGVIRSYQRPPCGGQFLPSKGEAPLFCSTGCRHQPTKYFIEIYWQKKSHRIYRTKRGEPLGSWRQARRTLESIRDQIDEKTFDPLLYKKDSAYSFVQFWERFKNRHSKARPSTRRILQAINKRMEFFRDYDIREIRGFHLEDFRQGLVDEGLESSYINHLLVYIRACLRYAVKVDALEKMPHVPEFLPVPEKEFQFLSREEQFHIFDFIPEYDQPIFLFLFLTGCRVSEAVALQREDVDWKKNLLLIRHTIDNNSVLQLRTKSRAIRIIPLVEDLQRLFRGLTPSLTGYIFLNHYGRRYSSSALRRTWYKALDEAGLKRIKLKNATRHSWAMINLMAGNDLHRVSKALGHSGLKTTEFYAKYLPEHLTDLYEGLATKPQQAIKSTSQPTKIKKNK